MNAARALLRDLASSVASANGILQACPTRCAPAVPNPMRHIAYADPHGAFTIAYRSGARQFSPAHGHKTWCTYQVLQGELSETHYRWDADASAAIACGGATRRPGDIVTATQGLHQIHRLGNASPEVAISLHIYGVDQADICSGVNHLIDKVLDASPRR